MHFYQILKKIIRTGVGKARFLMAAIGLGIAMLLILVALQVHHNFSELLYGERNQNERADFLVINKRITNEMMGNSALSTFKPEEIEAFKQQPFVDGFGVITAGQYNVKMVADQLGFSTELFFEAVPDSFIDVQTDQWKWQQGQEVVPVIVPSDFLDMFNFGFAMGNNIPQFSEETISSLTPGIVISQGMRSSQFAGRIVGFSDRISTVLVPMSFMEWANGAYGTGEEKPPSRVIIKTKDPSNPVLTDYLEQHGYSTNKEKTRFSKVRVIVQTIVSVVGFFGIVLLMFALLVFSMFIQLVIASCKREIRLLITLGAAPGQLQRYLLKQFVPLYIIIGLLALVMVTGLQWWASGLLARHQMFVPALPGIITFIAAAAILVLVYLVNLFAVRKHIAGMASS
ncbi:FtsX-like permease family protein [Chitinophaga sp. XS-30]|uniref:FtsX-like permease family protein n=1 Tax=Chitinophaga sp. XS-30 TaxID=2604421 RepID=UPI0011DD435F|nr:FtsX-like permease family protein [Chitinophaga sp. XS-30]QEH40187.1 FtsX-like permease family protein [Chitinophaga sp. XS-30]